MNIQLIAEICIVAIIVIAFIIWLVWQIKKVGLRQFAIDAIVAAEEAFEQGKNEEKMNYAIDKVIALIPMPISLFITRETVQIFIQKIFDSIKVALDYREVEEDAK